MKAIIKEINIRYNQRNGLAVNVIDRLRPVIVFAGQNGSGKTRLLNLIERSLTLQLRFSEIESQAKHEEKILNSNNFTDSRDRAQVENSLRIHREILTDHASIELNSPDKPYSIVTYKPQHARDFRDLHSLSSVERSTLLSTSGNVLNISSLFEQTITAIQVIAESALLFEGAMKLRPDMKNSEDNPSLRFKRLVEWIKKLLDMEIDFDPTNMQTKLGGHNLQNIRDVLSDGQKRILHFCVSTYNEVQRAEDCILLMDEPENFLHPKALNDLFDRLIDVLPNSQFIIATHSVPLIAHLGYDNVWSVSNGKATYAGRNCRFVLEGLLGGEDNIIKLRTLLQTPDRLALEDFVLECLTKPEIIGYQRKSDPQSEQVVGVISDFAERNDRPAKILDYGAGKGRIYSLLRESLGADFDESVSYFAFEENHDAANECREQFRTSGTPDNHLYLTKAELTQRAGTANFDFVLLCNVLHEIPVDDWIADLDRIKNILAPTGFMIVVEDLILPHGENAHKHGFLLVDHSSARKLFSLSSDPVPFEPKEERYKDRLTCYLIPASNVTVSEASIRAALLHIANVAADVIASLRKHDKSNYQDGNKHAVALLQYANASLALKNRGVS